MPWAVVEDITFERNVIRNAASGVQILGRDSGARGRVSRIRFKDNLFYNINAQDPPVGWGKPPYYTHSRVSGWQARSRMFQIEQEPPDVSIEHNTFIQAQGGPGGTSLMFFDPNSEPGVASGFRFTDNIGAWSVSGSSRAEGNPTLDFYTPAATFLKNALIGRNEALYPAGNFFPPDIGAVGFTSVADNNYRLAAGSADEGAGTDGKDLGADLDGAEDALRELRLVVIDIKPGEDSAGNQHEEPRNSAFGHPVEQDLLGPGHGRYRHPDVRRHRQGAQPGLLQPQWRGRERRRAPGPGVPFQYRRHRLETRR